MDDWERRVDAVWTHAAGADRPDDDELLARIDALASELDTGDPRGTFERAGARDSTGRTAEAIALYREALDGGLDPDRRRQAAVQLASSLRAIGEADEAVRILADELDRGESLLEPQVRAFYALALADTGREREAVGIAVETIGSLVTRYRRSLVAYGQDMADGPSAPTP